MARIPWVGDTAPRMGGRWSQPGGESSMWCIRKALIKKGVLLKKRGRLHCIQDIFSNNEVFYIELSKTYVDFYVDSKFLNC